MSALKFELVQVSLHIERCRQSGMILASGRQAEVKSLKYSATFAAGKAPELFQTLL